MSKLTYTLHIYYICSQILVITWSGHNVILFSYHIFYGKQQYSYRICLIFKSLISEMLYHKNKIINNFLIYFLIHTFYSVEFKNLRKQ